MMCPPLIWRDMRIVTKSVKPKLVPCRIKKEGSEKRGERGERGGDGNVSGTGDMGRKEKVVVVVCVCSELTMRTQRDCRL